VTGAATLMKIPAIEPMLMKNPGNRGHTDPATEPMLMKTMPMIMKIHDNRGHGNTVHKRTGREALPMKNLGNTAHIEIVIEETPMKRNGKMKSLEEDDMEEIATENLGIKVHMDSATVRDQEETIM